MKVLLKIIIGIVFVFLTNQILSQEIDKLGKKELRNAYNSKSAELDSLQQLFNDTLTAKNKEIINLNYKIDNLKNQINKIEIEMAECEKTTNTLTSKNKSVIDLIRLFQDSLQNSTSNYELRKTLIDMYLRNRVYKLRYYESIGRAGITGPDIFKIARIDDKYYTSDFSDSYNKDKPIIELANDEQTKKYFNWGIEIDNNFRFQYNDTDENKTGTINKTTFEWRDFSYSDSLYNSSVIFGENYIKLPIAIIELETIRGVSDFFIYLYIGRKDFSFNEKQYSSYCSIILTSSFDDIILTNTN